MRRRPAMNGRGYPNLDKPEQSLVTRPEGTRTNCHEDIRKIR